MLVTVKTVFVMTFIMQQATEFKRIALESGPSR